MYDKVKSIVRRIESNNLIFFVLLLVIIALGVSIRLNPMDKMIDYNGDYVPSGVDPYYFVRMSEHYMSATYNSTQIMYEKDQMRYLGHGEHTKELLPVMTVNMYKIANFVTPVDFYYFLLISPVIYFAISMLIFFALLKRITGNNIASLIATAMLSFSVLFFYRTSAGFYDHEAIGVLFFLLSLLSMVEVFQKKRWLDMYVYFPFVVMLTIYAWGGIAKILFVIYPLTFFLLYLKDVMADKAKPYQYLEIFTITFVMINFYALLYSYVGGLELGLVFNSYFLSYIGLPNIALVALYLVSLIVYNKNLNIKKTRRSIYSIVIVAVSGVVALIFTGRLKSFYDNIKNPIISNRVGLTVAENQGLSIMQIYDQIGIFYMIMFVVGMIMILYPFITRAIDLKMKRVNKFGSIKNIDYFLLVILIVSLYSLNSYIRMMFVNSILLSIFTGVVAGKLMDGYYNYKDTLVRTLVISFLIVFLIMSSFNVYTSYQITNAQSKLYGTSYSLDWQNAMTWVKHNTTNDSLFVHWWDYGYFIQTMGQRPTLTDGGHLTSYWDHTMARYLLTTSNEESAYQFLNTFNASYLLIDSSDIGKYTAFSQIGNHATENDRFSSVGQMLKNVYQTTETRNGSMFVYTGQYMVDDDIIRGSTVLASFKSAIVQVMIDVDNNGTVNNVTAIAADSRGIPVYMNVRYLNYNDQTIDLGSHNEYAGIVKLVPSYNEHQNTIDQTGGIIILSPRVANTFFAQTYILDNYNPQYIEKVYDAPKFTQYGKFVFAYGSLRGPISIYKIKDNPYGTNDEFLKLNGEYSEFDRLYY